jgi:8-oxo-dGTP pyrophosphatase MutT (NUDIX family)
MKVFGVAILIMRGGMVLSIARRNNHNDWGLPGGKVDEGETPAEAAVREFHEETGYTLINPTHVFTRKCGDDWAMTFTGNIEGQPGPNQNYRLGPSLWKDTENLDCFPLVAQEGEPPLSWKSPHELIHAPTFGEYNLNLFKHLGIKIN